MVREHTLYSFSFFKFVRFAFWPRIWLILKPDFRNSRALPTHCYLRLPQHLSYGSQCLAVTGREERPSAAFQGLWVGDRGGPWDPRALPTWTRNLVHPPQGALAVHDPSHDMWWTHNEAEDRVGQVQRSSQSRPCAPAPLPLSNGVVNEEGQLRCLRSLGPNLGDDTGLLPPSHRSAGRPVPTLANSPRAKPRTVGAAIAAAVAAAAARIVYTGLPARCKQLTPHLLPTGPTRTVRNFGLASCLESSHLSMSTGTRLVSAVPTGSFHLPLPERWTPSGFTHSTRTRAGSLPGEYRAPSGQPAHASAGF